MLKKFNNMKINDAFSKISLCCNELLIIKEILNTKEADDFCSRILAIYAMVRVDDIMKIWGNTISKSDKIRSGYEKILRSYNDGLRKVRDKLGAHFQSPSISVDLFGSVKIFKKIDYANTLCLIDQIFEFQEKRVGTKVKRLNVNNDEDRDKVVRILRDLYSDDKAYLTNGVLDLFGINKGGLISCSEAQGKGQYLRSIEQMVKVSYALVSMTYNEKMTANLFKRLFICTVYNYHDNLITRTDINSNAVQYEEGFDKLFLGLITAKDNKAELETAFNKYENSHHIDSFIKRYRMVRDHACAHLDEKNDVMQIEAELDELDVEELYDVYTKMLELFNYICNNVTLLQPIAIPNRTRIYDAQIESSPDAENYYGEKPDLGEKTSFELKDVFRSIRRHDRGFDEAVDKLNSSLKSSNEAEYREIIDTIAERLCQANIPEVELSTIINALCNAKRGYPERLQHSILAMLDNKRIKESNKIHLLWVLSSICVEDKQYDIDHYLDSLVMQRIPVLTGYATLACLHKTVEKTRSCIVARNRAHEVNVQFVNYCKSLNNVAETLALLLMMNQRWFHDPEYSHYRSYEAHYNEFLEREISIALRGYLSYIKLTDEGEYKIYISYLETKHYLLLLYRLAVKEKERRQDHNVFLELWNSNCFYRTRFDVYEALGVGLMTELSGQIDLARDIFESIVKDNPINEGAIQTLDQFNERHNKLNK